MESRAFQTKYVTIMKKKTASDYLSVKFIVLYQLLLKNKEFSKQTDNNSVTPTDSAWHPNATRLSRIDN